MVPNPSIIDIQISLIIENGVNSNAKRTFDERHEFLVRYVIFVTIDFHGQHQRE